MFMFKDGEHAMMYIPSLELSSYGDDFEEAGDMMMNHVIPAFCESIFEEPKSIVTSSLKKMGWAKNPFFRKELSRKSFMGKEGILKEFDLAPDTEINEQLVAVA